ncbi:hypothetical protein ScPMuIL_018105, partial [Solemya velum]
QQEKDPEISLLCNRALSEEEAEKVPVCYFRRSGVLMRKWRPPDVSPEEDWKVVNQIVIKQYKSSAYHSESQGALERFHQTLKNMMRSYCFENKEIGMKVYTCCCLALGNLYKNLLASVPLNLCLDTL